MGLTPRLTTWIGNYYQSPLKGEELFEDIKN